MSGVASGKAAPLVGGPPGVELHTMVDDVPSGDTWAMVPVVLPRIGEGIVPSGAAGVIARDDIVVVDDIVAVVAPATGTVLITVDGAGTGTGVMVGDGRGGSGGGCGAGMVVPKKSVMNDVAGCADSVKYCVVVLSVVGADETVGTAGIGEIDGIVPGVTGIADVEVTGTVGVPGVICPVGVEQVTTVPGVEGSEAIGTGASVVSGVPG